jgi:hypothetical protein
MSRLTESETARLDILVPPRGPCGFCGGPDARHRLFDAIREQANAGDSRQMIIDNYELSPETVDLILRDR